MVGIGWGEATPAQRTGFLSAVAIGAAVRAGYLASKWDQELLLNDSLWYSAQAVVIARGEGFADPFYGGPSAEHGPLTPIVLAAVSWMDDPVPWQRLVMTVVGTVTVALVGLVAARIAGWWAGVAAAWIAAVYPNLWMNDALVMSETLATVCVVGVVWLATDLVRRPDDGSSGRRATSTVTRAVACGVMIGLAALARSELILLAPILAFVVWRSGASDGRRHREPLVLLAGAFVTVLPWVAPNLVRFERPVLLTTNDGTTLLGANCDDSWSGGDIGGWSLFCVVEEGAPSGEDPSVRSARHRRLAVDHVVDNVERVPLVVGARIGRALDIVGVENLVAADVGEERPRWASWAGIAAWWALAVLAVIGVRQLTGGVRAVLLAPVVGVAITTVAFYGGHRIRTPLEPVVVVLAGVAVASLASRATVGSPRTEALERTETLGSGLV